MVLLTCAGAAAKPTTATKGLDIEAQGTINGVPVYEFDLNTIENEEKPWRKPGENIETNILFQHFRISNFYFVVVLKREFYLLGMFVFDRIITHSLLSSCYG